MRTILPRIVSSLLAVLLGSFVFTSSVRAENAGRGRSVAVNGIELYYETHGEGEPLILLHGFNGSIRAWEKFVPDLAKDFKVIAVDMRGHGRSTNPSNEFTHRQSARDIFALMDSLGLEKIKAMGISSGGMTLLHMATQQPSRIDSMVLIGATIYFPPQSREIMSRRTPESLTAAEIERSSRVHVRGEEQIRALRGQFNRMKDSYDDMNFTRPYLSTIKARTLIVHGDRDAHFPVNIPVEMYESIPRSYLWIVPGGGHVPINDVNVPFAAVARQFLGAAAPYER